MPKKTTNPTVTTGYLQGAKHIVKFMRYELGDKKSYDKKIAALKAEARKLNAEGILTTPENIQYMDKKMHDLKEPNGKYYALWEKYGKTMTEYFPKVNKNSNEKEIEKFINEDELDRLMTQVKDARNSDLFSRDRLNWSSGSAAVSAMNKFSLMMLDNDFKKYQYFKECLDEAFPNDDITLEEVLSRPLPKTKEPTPSTATNLSESVNALYEKLEKTEGFHSNSAEYKAMKDALKALKDGLATGIENDEIGGLLETLQAASMDYVDAKGVGMQVTQRGKDRMDAALDICTMSMNNMDFYASKGRIKEIWNYEIRAFGKKITMGDGICDYTNVSYNVVEDENTYEEVQEMNNKEEMQAKDEERRRNLFEKIVDDDNELDEDEL